jgi:hypothetical protein
VTSSLNYYFREVLTKLFAHPVQVHKHKYINTYTPLLLLYSVMSNRIIRITENVIVVRQATMILSFKGIKSFIVVFTNSPSLVLIFLHVNPPNTLTHFHKRPFLIFLMCSQSFQIISPFWYSDFHFVCVSSITAPTMSRRSKNQQE